MTELAASHYGIKGPGVTGETAPGGRRAPHRGFPRQSASRRSRARPAALRPAPAPRLPQDPRSPALARHVRRSPRGRRRPVPPASRQSGPRTHRPARDSPGVRRPAPHRAPFLRPAAPTSFVVNSSHGNGAAHLPPPLCDPAPRWLRPKVSRPT